ncbi:MAG: TolC family protein [Candidatus Thiodiazotropha sp.]
MRLWWVLAISWLSACSSVPRDYSPVTPIEDAPDRWQEVEFPQAGEYSLLGMVGIPAIETWLNRVLRENPDMNRQLLQLAEAGWAVQQERASGYPTLSLDTSVSRVRPAGDSMDTFSDHKLTLNSAWEIDIWGRLADRQQASEWDEASLAADLRYARRSLVANFIKAWLEWVNGAQRLRVEQDRHETFQLNAQIVRERYRAGIGSLQDLATAMADTEQVQADVALQQAALDASQRRMQALLGSMKALSGLPDQWPEIGFPQVDLPAASLGQRPDLHAAYQRIRAADTRSQVAYKSLLPSFTLNVDVTQTLSTSGQLLSGDPGWQLLGQLTQPLFQGGRLRAELHAAQDRAGQAYWEYREKLLAALLEVEAGLNQEHHLAKQYTALLQARQHAQQSEQHIERRYRQGLTGILDLLRAQQTTFDIEIRLLQVAVQRASNRIDLGLALGLPIKQRVTS